MERFRQYRARPLKGLVAAEYGMISDGARSVHPTTNPCGYGVPVGFRRLFGRREIIMDYIYRS